MLDSPKLDVVVPHEALERDLAPAVAHGVVDLAESSVPDATLDREAVERPISMSVAKGHALAPPLILGPFPSGRSACVIVNVKSPTSIGVPSGTGSFGSSRSPSIVTDAFERQ